MGKLRNLYAKLSKLSTKDVEEEVLSIIRDNEDVIVDANTSALMRGENSDGTPVEPPYSSALYAAFKLTLNPAGVVDLNLTGDFHREFFVKAERFPITIDSKDEKTPELAEHYGRKKIFGVQPAELGKINHTNIKEGYQKYILRLLDV